MNALAWRLGLALSVATGTGSIGARAGSAPNSWFERLNRDFGRTRELLR